MKSRINSHTRTRTPPTTEGSLSTSCALFLYPIHLGLSPYFRPLHSAGQHVHPTYATGLRLHWT